MSYTLITGATSDIGVQICKTLEDSGHNLLMTDLRLDLLEDLKKNLICPERHVILALDLSNVDQSKESLTVFLKEKGR